MQQYLKALKVYSILTLAIAAWWVLAFSSSAEKSDFGTNPNTYSSSFIRPALEPAITSIDRDLLHQALSGDSKLMARLIADWDIDAQILDSQGFDGIKRISRGDFLQSQSLIRTLQNEEAVKKSASLLKQQNQYVMDDSGNLIDLKLSYKKFLPQTYASASFLLSLVSPAQIVALPRSLREQTQLYSKALTNQIPLDIDRYNAEKLFQARPEVAFVAHYSHPATIQALTKQGVTLYTMKDIKTLPDISRELTHLGNITEKPLHAELLKIFIDAAIVAIDNQQAILIKHFNQHSQHLPRVLVVNFHQGFSVPTTNTLTGQLLSRMQSLDITLQYALDSEMSNAWSVPIDRERLLNLDPDYLIIATDNERAMAKEICNDKALQSLSAVRNNHLAFVDESIQKTPSQFVVLAYHDLIQALI
ncbi:MAG TPA: ABC transporter substrate-binding protein, partial [Parachlamydiaceae bacterium]|nr:ABC transporter substrate-binding protein [Parachlamydiaceae bacterium]